MILQKEGGAVHLVGPGTEQRTIPLPGLGRFKKRRGGEGDLLLSQGMKRTSTQHALKMEVCYPDGKTQSKEI